MEFHIHINADYLSEDLKIYLLEYGFYVQEFAIDRSITKTSAVNFHLTKKYTSSILFKKEFKEITTYRIEKKLVGYIEGEYVAKNISIPYKPFSGQEICLPFIVTKHKPLLGTFRETEIHVSLNLNLSHRKILQAFESMGFDSIVLLKKEELYKVFSLQGNYEDISNVFDLTVSFLNNYGGAYNCKLKEERTAKWWLSSIDVPQPEIVKYIDFSPQVI